MRREAVRRAAKIDDNHKEIVKLLRQHGATVQSLAAIGHGCPDLLVGHNNRNWLVEVKDGRKSLSRQKLTQDEKEWIAKWRGQVDVVTNVLEAYQLVFQSSGQSSPPPEPPSGA